MSLPETTLANPLLESDYEEFLYHYSTPQAKHTSEVGRLAQALSRTPGVPHLSQVRRHRSEVTPSLSVIGEYVVPERVMNSYLDEVAIVVQQMVKSLDSNLKGMSNEGYPGLPGTGVQTITNNPTLRLNWKYTLYWLNVVDKVVQSAKSKRWVQWQQGWFSRRMSLIPHQGIYYLLTTDACLMFKDMMYSRFLIHLYCHLDPLRRHLSHKLNQFVVWGAEVLRDLKNGGYDVIKGIEALTQTALIQREERVLDGQAQHLAMLAKYRDKEMKVGGTGIYIDRLGQYLESFEDSRDLAEAFGFLKLWGHPYVDPRGGCISAKTLAQEDLHLNPGACLRLEWSFCHLYCRGYLRKKNRWPPLRFIPKPDGTITRLEELCTQSQPALAFGFTQYSAEDWQWAQFESHISFDRGEDILGLVVDRAISYKRSEFDASWPTKLEYKPPKATTSSRVLEELITRPAFDLSEVTERVARRDIPHDWKIVTVSPKEREMKREPRMFSMMVLEMRLFFVLTEHNIAEGIFKYLPEQTMTLSRSELLEVFLQSTRPLPGAWIRAVLGIDFSRWNLLWRAESVHPIGRRLNEIYGTPGVFDIVHDFFSECLCVLRSGGYPPEGLTSRNRHDPPEGGTLWYNHLGGFEGIAQKLWTTCTIALIHMSLWPLGLSYRIIGQGDNQVCILDCYIPPTTPRGEAKGYIRSLVDRAAQSIADRGLEVGQIVKPEECIYSTCFLTYGKEMILRGAYLPTSLKYISRMFPATTGDAPSLHEMVSSISSGAVGAPDRNDWSYPTWVLAKIIEGLTFIRESKWSLLHGEKIRSQLERLGVLGGVSTPDSFRSMLLLLLSIPANLGGFPITTVPELLYRGHSDPLSSSLLHVCLMDKIPIVEQYKRVLLKGWVLDPTPDLEGLILDPYSIPLKATPVPTSAVAKETGRILPDITHNLQFRDLFDRSTQQDREGLLVWLSSMTPLYSKLAHDIYKSSMVGLRDAFIRRFSNTRTVISIGRRGGADLASVSVSADWASIQGITERFVLSWKIGESNPTFRREEGYAMGVLLRRAWLKGEVVEGVTNGHPLSVGRLEWFPAGEMPASKGCRIQVMGLSTRSDLGTTTRGTVRPYLGSGTGDKAVAKWVRPTDSSPPLRDVLKLLIIRDMVALPGSSLYSDLTALAQSRSMVNVRFLTRLLRIKIGGTLAHRYRTRDDPLGSFWNSCFNWPSHLTISTNLAGQLGEQDYPFDFKEAMLSLAALTCWGYSRQSIQPPWGIQLVVDISLMEPVVDHIVQALPYSLTFSTPSPSYYSSVIEVTLSQRALTTARLANDHLALPLPEGQSSIVQAVCAVVLSHIRRGNPVTTRFGHTIGIPSSTRLIDIPEGYNITTEEMISGATLAIWLKLSYGASLLCSRRKRRPDLVTKKMWDLEVRRSIPALAATLRCVDHGYPSHGLGLELGQEAEMNSLARWMHIICKRGVNTLPVGPFMVYQRGLASVSSSLAAGLSFLALRECLSPDPARFKAGKLLVNMVRSAMTRFDEPTAVRLLCVIITSCNLTDWFRVDTRSPEEILRELRGRGGEGYQGGPGGQVFRTQRVDELEFNVLGGSSPLVYQAVKLTSAELVSSWRHRYLQAPAPAERWSPLRIGHPGLQRVLLLGVGSGHIGGALPLDWHVTGVELGQQLERLGHDSTTYSPPGLVGRFTLHPVSWVMGGDVLSTRVQDTLITELSKGKYTLVVIDVEGVATIDRLRLRHQLAQTGVPTYCKILVSREDRDELVASWGAYRAHGDRIWTTMSYPQCEFIVGSSSSPLGLYTAVPAPDRILPTVSSPISTDYHTQGYPRYNLGADLLCLTGHMAVPDTRGITYQQCRAIHSYAPNPRKVISSQADFSSFCVLLLDNGCPRSRVKALVQLMRRRALLLDNW